MSSFKTAAIKIYQTKSCRIRSESPPETGGPKGHSFGSCKRAQIQGRNGLR